MNLIKCAKSNIHTRCLPNLVLPLRAGDEPVSHQQKLQLQTELHVNIKYASICPIYIYTDAATSLFGVATVLRSIYTIELGKYLV